MTLRARSKKLSRSIRPTRRSFGPRSMSTLSPTPSLTTTLRYSNATMQRATSPTKASLFGFQASLAQASPASPRCLALRSRIATSFDEPAGERFAARTNNRKIHVHLRQIAENIPTHAVIFDVSTDRGIRSGNQTLTEIMYRLFLDSLGYPKDLDLAELEISLESERRLDRFLSAFEEVTGGRQWDSRKGVVAFALSEASAAMRAIEPNIYADNDSWAKANKGKADITPRLLAMRVSELIERRKPGHNVLFVVDEVGQFVARDVNKMLDLQAIVQQLGIHGHGKHWLAVTSQEKLGELVSGLDDMRIEHARLMDRFRSQVHLEPSDISEVTSKRVLAKNASAQKELGTLYRCPPRPARRPHPAQCRDCASRA